MGRYSTNIESHKSVREINKIINGYLTDESFRFISEGQVWRQRRFLTNSYIKIELLENVVHIEAWLQSLYALGLEVSPMIQSYELLTLAARPSLTLAINELRSRIIKLELSLK